MSSLTERFNNAVNDSFIGRYFEMKERNTTFTVELRGALATFLATAYILAVNPRIIADSGGPCQAPLNDEGEPQLFDPDFEACMEDVKRQLVTSTALASMFGCFLMGFLANLPIALSSGMGMNAYFTYNVVGWRGTNNITYETALTAVLIEGAIFFVLAVTGVRYAIIRLVPEPVKLATPAAIGAFLAHLGLQTAEGIGVVVSDIATAVTLGACPESKRTPIVALTEDCKLVPNGEACVVSDAYTCDEEGGIMSSGTAWMGILGLMLMVIMLAYKQRVAFVAGIALVTFVSWFRGTAVTYFPDTPDGDARFDYFRQVVSVTGLDKVVAQYSSDFQDVGLALFTFLYVDFLDTSGTLLALASQLGYVDEQGDFPKSRHAFAADALSTMFGSIFGLSPVTSFVESAAGVEAGSRTGLTAVLCGLFFFLSLFFAPLLASIPPWATGGALVVVGALMAKSLAKVKWHDPSHAVTAFVTFIIMPLTYSIAYGLIAGIGCWTILQTVFRLGKLLGIEPPVYDDEDGPPAVHHDDAVEKPENNSVENDSDDADPTSRMMQEESFGSRPAKNDSETA